MQVADLCTKDDGTGGISSSLSSSLSYPSSEFASASASGGGGGLISNDVITTTLRDALERGYGFSFMVCT